jgi:hypothetical protein
MDGDDQGEPVERGMKMLRGLSQMGWVTRGYDYGGTLERIYGGESECIRAILSLSLALAVRDCGASRSSALRAMRCVACVLLVCVCWRNKDRTGLDRIIDPDFPMDEQGYISTISPPPPHCYSSSGNKSPVDLASDGAPSRRPRSFIRTKDTAERHIRNDQPIHVCLSPSDHIAREFNGNLRPADFLSSARLVGSVGWDDDALQFV